MPAILFVEELLELYPDLKFVLVIRDPQKWWNSLSHLLDYVDAWYLPLIFSVAPGLRWAPVLVNEWKIRTQQRMKVLGKKPGDYGPCKSSPSFDFPSSFHGSATVGSPSSPLSKPCQRSA